MSDVAEQFVEKPAGFDDWFRENSSLPDYNALPLDAQERFKKRFLERAKMREYAQKPEVKAKKREYMREYMRKRSAKE